MSDKLKIAIACPGIGRVQRGFERYFSDLFHLLKYDYDITLFKGGGDNLPNEKVLHFIYRNGCLARYLPLHRLFGRTAIHSECLTFALALLWEIRRGKFDIVHCIDPPLARILFQLRALIGMDFKLLYTEGCAMPPEHYPPADHIHQVAEETLQDATRFGIPKTHMTLIPCGIHSKKFDSEKNKQALRRTFGISPDTFVILSVAALNRSHKRMHYLIEEVSNLDGDLLLWLDSSMDQGEPDLIDMANARLGRKCRITHLPSQQVADLYRLADVLVHAATAESFGLAIVEAASIDLPVVIHNAPHFRWLVPEAAHVDMTRTGALTQRLTALMADRDQLNCLRCGPQTIQRYDWTNLKAQYLALYRKVADLSPPITQSA